MMRPIFSMVRSLTSGMSSHFRGDRWLSCARHSKIPVEDYLAFCAKRGEEPNQPFSGRLTVRQSPEQHRRVILAAERAGKDVERWITEVLEQAVGLSLRDQVRA